METAVQSSPLSARVLRRQDQTRQNILAAATPLFVDQGIHGTSVGDILDAADVSRGTFYKFFRNRNDVAAHIIRPMFIHLGDALGRIDSADPFEVIDSIIAVYADAWRGSPDALLLATRDGPALYEWFESEHGLARDHLRRLLEQVEPHGILRAGKADYAVALLARTTVTVLRVFAGDPDWEHLFASTLRGYLIDDPHDTPAEKLT